MDQSAYNYLSKIVLNTMRNTGENHFINFVLEQTLSFDSSSPDGNTKDAITEFVEFFQSQYQKELFLLKSIITDLIRQDISIDDFWDRSILGQIFRENPLIKALHDNNLKLFRLLLEMGANLNARKGEESVLETALYYRFREIFNIILEGGYLNVKEMSESDYHSLKRRIQDMIINGDNRDTLLVIYEKIISSRHQSTTSLGPSSLFWHCARQLATEFKKVVRLEKTETPDLKVIAPDTLGVLLEHDILTVYWLDQGKKTIKNRAFIACPSIVDKIPEIGGRSEDPHLIKEIVDQYGCSSVLLLPPEIQEDLKKEMTEARWLTASGF